MPAKVENTNDIIKIQNLTDTKHEVIIDTGADELPSSDDIASKGQSAFSPNMTGTFTYHCAYTVHSQFEEPSIIAKP
jgi:hypothetical protein